jgi:cell division protein FtsN
MNHKLATAAIALAFVIVATTDAMAGAPEYAPQHHVAKASQKAAQDPALAGYFVQVGAYKDAGRASRAVVEIRAKFAKQLGGSLVFATNSDLDGTRRGKWMRVMAGPFKSRDEADAMCGKLSDVALVAITGRVCFVWGADANRRKHIRDAKN